MGEGFTFFVVYGSSTHLVNLDDVHVTPREYPLLSAKEVNLAIKKTLRRRLVVVGACIGTDAHTVGIDAILNIKGFAGEKGLEYYREITVVNLGAQVLVPELVEAARAEKADAVLVSQVVTQKDAHVHNTTQMSAAFREAYPAGTVPVLIAGGPRFEDGSEAALGVDRIFGRGTTPGEVASFLVHEITTRKGTALMSQSSHRPTRAEVGLCGWCTGATCPTTTRTTPATSSTGRTRWPPSATSRRRCASPPMATTRGCSPSYSDVQFVGRIQAGDVIEISAEILRVGSRSRELQFEVLVVGRGRPDERSAGSAELLDPPVVATTARGTVVVP